ncbi:MAG: hypothetical protein J6P05_04215 [Lachnospiraceae bacterium]|nr:hypothetical protein [Lachnospiraceae bacterium]
MWRISHKFKDLSINLNAHIHALPSFFRKARMNGSASARRTIESQGFALAHKIPLALLGLVLIISLNYSAVNALANEISDSVGIDGGLINSESMVDLLSLSDLSFCGKWRSEDLSLEIGSLDDSGYRIRMGFGNVDAYEAWGLIEKSPLHGLNALRIESPENPRVNSWAYILKDGRLHLFRDGGIGANLIRDGGESEADSEGRSAVINAAAYEGDFAKVAVSLNENDLASEVVSANGAVSLNEGDFASEVVSANEAVSLSESDFAEGGSSAENGSHTEAGSSSERASSDSSEPSGSVSSETLGALSPATSDAAPSEQSVADSASVSSGTLLRAIDEPLEWDSTLFYWLEDTDPNDDYGGNLKNYEIIYGSKKDGGEDRIRYEIYKNRENGELNKVTVRTSSGNKLGLRTDYYFDEDGINFIFERPDSEKPLSYATRFHEGLRLFFSKGRLAKVRRVEVPKVLLDNPGTAVEEEIWKKKADETYKAAKEIADKDP